MFGCGGDRDHGKRPEMGAVAGRLADRIVVTSDNPRSEDPVAIASGDRRRHPRPRRTAAGRVELDRAEAIRAAVAAARAGDVVLLAGKGHEDYQETNGVRRHFSDARRRRRRAGARGAGA